MFALGKINGLWAKSFKSEFSSLPMHLSMPFSSSIIFNILLSWSKLPYSCNSVCAASTHTFSALITFPSVNALSSCCDVPLEPKSAGYSVFLYPQSFLCVNFKISPTWWQTNCFHSPLFSIRHRAVLLSNLCFNALAFHSFHYTIQPD